MRYITNTTIYIRTQGKFHELILEKQVQCNPLPNVDDNLAGTCNYLLLSTIIVRNIISITANEID